MANLSTLSQTATVFKSCWQKASAWLGHSALPSGSWCLTMPLYPAPFLPPGLYMLDWLICNLLWCHLSISLMGFPWVAFFQLCLHPRESLDIFQCVSLYVSKESHPLLVECDFFFIISSSDTPSISLGSSFQIPAASSHLLFFSVQVFSIRL